MKIKIIPLTLSVLIATLSGYAFFTYAIGGDNTLLGVGSATTLALTLLGMFGFSLETKRKAINIHVVSGVFNTLFLIISIVFAFLHDFSRPTYLLVNGILLLIWLLITYGIATKTDC